MAEKKGRRRRLVIANWKMNPRSVSEAKALFSAVKKEVVRFRNVQVVIAPPAPYLAELRKQASGATHIQLGAQDVSEEKEGAHTGEVSASMLKSLGAEYVVVGHSERRARGETDAAVQKKVKMVVSANLTAVVCVGERERDQGGKYLGAIEEQIRTALRGIPRTKLGNIIIAYEPVWAISTTPGARPATAEDVHEMALYIEKVLADMYGRATAAQVAILYGGSVNPKNIDDLAAHGEVSGYLVGNTSLRARDLGAVVRRIHEQN